MRDVLREAFGWKFWIFVPIVVGVILLSGLVKLLSGAVLRDPQDLFGQLMMSPVALLVPVIATAIGSTTLYTQLHRRFAASTRTRESAAHYVRRRLLSGAVATFALFLAVVLVVGVVAFRVWPSMQPELFDLEVYGLDPVSARIDAVERESYSQLLAFGPVGYVAGYGVVLGCAAAALATLGNVTLLTVRPIWLGLVAPIVLYLIESILAALAGVPYFGLLFALFPFGLDQQSLAVALLPIAGVVLLAVVAGFIVVRGASSLEHLR